MIQLGLKKDPEKETFRSDINQPSRRIHVIILTCLVDVGLFVRTNPNKEKEAITTSIDVGNTEGDAVGKKKYELCYLYEVYYIVVLMFFLSNT